MLSYREARRKVIEITRGLQPRPAREVFQLAQAFGRVLAEDLSADRDYPPFDRSTRDGFAVKSADVVTEGATLACIGECRAGHGFEEQVGTGQCVEIMTGAGVPAGADAVVMIEHVRKEGDRVVIKSVGARGQNIVPRGREARAGQVLVESGTRLGVAEMGIAAQVGRPQVTVFARPRVAVLSTGDEVVDIAAAPGALQIRNGNGLTLATLAALAGAEVIALGNAADNRDALRQSIGQGLQADLLVIAGGVSKGKYDLVEDVLAEMGAEIAFDRVAIRPGQPTVFGLCQGKPVLGLPGNPVSSMVTFELFGVPVVDLLSGAEPQQLSVLYAQLAHEVKESGNLTHFLPAQVRQTEKDTKVSLLRWQGSGDVAALAQANAFLVVPAEKSEWAAGEWAMVLLRRGHGGGWC